VDPSSYHHAVLVANVTDGVTNEFLRERVGVARANDIYDKEVPGALWTVRYFRDREPEEYIVVLKPDGSLVSVHHKLAEDAPGASLTKEEAVARGEDFLRKQKRIDLQQWSLVESTSYKRPHRVDHVLTWQQNQALDAGATGKSSSTAGAHERLEVQILGDEVSNYRAYIKIPDDWRRQQEDASARIAIDGVTGSGLWRGDHNGADCIPKESALRGCSRHSMAPHRDMGALGARGLFGDVRARE
jgi:hypothetical protein